MCSRAICTTRPGEFARLSTAAPIHPTAEGHAAMADAALEGAHRALHLPPPDAPITAATLPLPR
jgi:hypothetical protein